MGEGGGPRRHLRHITVSKAGFYFYLFMDNPHIYFIYYVGLSEVRDGDKLGGRTRVGGEQVTGYLFRSTVMKARNLTRCSSHAEATLLGERFSEVESRRLA